MNIDDAADELYGRPLDEFVSARTDLVKQAKSAGDPGTAEEIKALRKPTAAAWILNRLVRAEHLAVADLVALGEAMRSATSASDGATLRDLTAARKKSVGDLVRTAEALATESGQRVSADMVNSLNDTLLAAVADPRAGAELLQGRLTKPLEHTGFGTLPSETSAEVISLSAARTAHAPKRSGKRSPGGEGKARDDKHKPEADTGREAAIQELRDAEAVLDDAETRVSTLRTTVSELRERADHAKADVDRLSAELETAQRTLRDAEAAAESAEGGLESARRDVDSASRRRRDARLAAHRYTG